MTGYAAAPHGDHDHTRVDQGLDRNQVRRMSFGSGEGTTRRQPRPDVLHHRPAHFLLAAFGFGLFHETADRFAGILEGRIILVHHRVWVMMVQAFFLMPRRNNNSFCSACWNS